MSMFNSMKWGFIAMALAPLLSGKAQARVHLQEKVVKLASAAELANDPYYTLKEVRIKPLTEKEWAQEERKVQASVTADKRFVETPRGPGIEIPPRLPPRIDKDPAPAPTPVEGPMGDVILVIDKLIALGEKLVPIIEKGRPVVSHNPMAPISVLPKFDSPDGAFYQMGGWSNPVSNHFKIVYYNGFNREAISFVYSVSYQYNGNYQGKGKYLTGLRASAKNIKVGWGFDLDANSQLIQISNVGTAEEPIAGATVEISYTVKNMLQVLVTNEAFFIGGDGRFNRLD